jgi:hypothetical protein
LYTNQSSSLIPKVSSPLPRSNAAEASSRILSFWAAFSRSPRPTPPDEPWFPFVWPPLTFCRFLCSDFSESSEYRARSSSRYNSGFSLYSWMKQITRTTKNV